MVVIMVDKIKQLLLYASNDKTLHLLYCYLITTMSLGLFGLLGIIIPVIISLVKEIYDYYYGTGHCWYDLLADGAGIILGIVFVMVK